VQQKEIRRMQDEEIQQWQTLYQQTEKEKEAEEEKVLQAQLQVQRAKKETASVIQERDEAISLKKISEKEAEKAKRRAVKADRRAEEADRRAVEAEKRTEEANMEVVEANMEVVEANMAVVEANRRIEEKNMELVEANKNTEKANKKMAEKEKEIETLKSDAQQAHRKTNYAQEEIQQYKQQLQESEGEKWVALQENVTLTQKNAALIDKLKRKKISATTKIQHLEDTIAILISKIQQVEEERQDQAEARKSRGELHTQRADALPLPRNTGRFFASPAEEKGNTTPLPEPF
jgi:hypothetical protein